MTTPTQEAQDAWQARQDASAARAQAERDRQTAWVRTWVAAHVWTPNPAGGMVGTPRPGWAWPQQTSVKTAMRAAQ